MIAVRTCSESDLKRHQSLLQASSDLIHSRLSHEAAKEQFSHTSEEEQTLDAYVDAPNENTFKFVDNITKEN